MGFYVALSCVSWYRGDVGVRAILSKTGIPSKHNELEADEKETRRILMSEYAASVNSDVAIGVAMIRDAFPQCILNNPLFENETCDWSELVARTIAVVKGDLASGAAI